MMTDYTMGGMDEENPELRRLNAEVMEDPDSYNAWEKLVQAAENQEGTVNRNSSPAAISAVREIYNRFLAKFPLFFGYWKKYADLEFSIAGTESAELIYERGVACISNSVDLWSSYCEFKVNTSHDPEPIRELWERGASAVGLDFLSHPFWDKYIEYEERLEAWDKVFDILSRLIHIPMHQYARYFERFRILASSRSVKELVPSDVFAQILAELKMEPANADKSDHELDAQIRERADAHHLTAFNRTQAETNRRWTYEQEIKRPYFHVLDLDETQLANWRKYLEFEQHEGDYQRITFLYERCLVTAAYYDEFWLRYVQWMQSISNKQEEVRHIYIRASCFYAAIARPELRLQYALFEETNGRIDIAQDIYEGMLMTTPGHIPTIVAWAHSVRRNSGVDAALEVYRAQIAANAESVTKATLTAELAKMLWKCKGDPEAARNVFRESAASYMDSRVFWTSFLQFEIEQPTTEDNTTQHNNVRQVMTDIRRRTSLSKEVLKELAQTYMTFLIERVSTGAAKEYLTLDRELLGNLAKGSQPSKGRYPEESGHGESDLPLEHPEYFGASEFLYYTSLDFPATN